MSHTNPDPTIACACHPICSRLGVEIGMWCSYRKSDLPPPGMHAFDPKDSWCPAGVRTNILMLGYMLAGNTGDARQLEPILDEVRGWARQLREKPAAYSPTEPREK